MTGHHFKFIRRGQGMGKATLDGLELDVVGFDLSVATGSPDRVTLTLLVETVEVIDESRVGIGQERQP